MKNWERKILSDVCKLSSDRININKLSVKNYISTENLLQNKGGKVDASALPSAGQVVAFSPKTRSQPDGAAGAGAVGSCSV